MKHIAPSMKIKTNFSRNCCLADGFIEYIDYSLARPAISAGTLRTQVRYELIRLTK